MRRFATDAVFLFQHEFWLESRGALDCGAGFDINVFERSWILPENTTCGDAGAAEWNEHGRGSCSGEGCAASTDYGGRVR